MRIIELMKILDCEKGGDQENQGQQTLKPSALHVSPEARTTEHILSTCVYSHLLTDLFSKCQKNLENQNKLYSGKLTLA